MKERNPDDVHAECVREMSDGIWQLVSLSHTASKARGWWHDPITGLSLIPHENPGTMPDDDKIISAWFPYVIATKIALIHAEVSEGLEAYRTDAMDDKIPAFAGITAEMADVLIRVGDLMGCMQARAKELAGPTPVDKVAAYNMFSLPSAIYEKMLVNAVRPDHNQEARRKPGGKKF